MSETTVGARIVDILAREGVTTVFGYPTTPFLEHAAVAGLRPVISRQERVGVNMADGYARTTAGAPFGVFCMQYGPGAENAFSGIATAYADSVPMLVLPMAPAGDRENVDRYFSSIRSYESICKSVQRIRTAEESDAVMRRAIAALRSGRPGPVLVEVPAEVSEAPAPTADPWIPLQRARPAPEAAAVDAAVGLLVAAERPVVVAGQGVLYADATAALVAFAEFLRIPVSTTLAGKGAFPESHPLSLGCGGMTKSQTVHDHLRDADVVLALGASMMSHPMTTAVPPGKTLIHVSLDAADFDRDYPTAVPIQADARLAVEAMLEVARTHADAHPTHRQDPAPAIAASREAWRGGWQANLTSDAVPIDPYRVVDEICRAFPAATSIVTHDSGSPRDQIVPFYPADEPHSYLGWGKSHALGTGLGLAMGAKLAAPDKYCVALMGDAAFGMTGLDLETAVRHDLPVVAIVNNNQTMAIETGHMARSHERFSTRDIGGDYRGIALALGAQARTVEDPDALAEAFAWAKERNDAGETALIDVRTSPVMTEFSLRGV